MLGSISMREIAEQIKNLCDAGLFLINIPPKNGKPSKSPSGGWNKPKSDCNPNGYSNNPDDFKGYEGINIGLYHDPSDTISLDMDNMKLIRQLFENTTDIQLLDWLESELRFEIKSPKANRGKLLFKFPLGFKGNIKQYKHNGEMIFELRCGNCQDVIVGQHPEGGEYQIIGNPASIPEAPPILLDMLQHWDDWKLAFDSVLNTDAELPKYKPHKPQKGENVEGWRNPIAEFNQAYSVADVLIRNGYEDVGKDRFIRPNSSSKAAGAVILHNCKDGIERVYSHGGDALNNGFAHDAFDCFRILEHGGEL